MVLSNVYHWWKGGGSRTGAHLSRWTEMAREIHDRSEKLRTWTDDLLLRQSRELRWRAKTGEPLKELLLDAYALVRETSGRVLGMRHFPVQIIGGIALFEGHIAEMQTGEGKTLTATSPAFLRALPGLGCHVITVNDYLAGRDAEIMGPLYRKLGLDVACIQSPMEPPERREAYAKDITYVTAKELGFDFLRDRLRTGAGGSATPLRSIPGLPSHNDDPPVQRGHYYALIDEADSILIDEARTPLIIGVMLPNDPATVNLMRWAHRTTFHLKPDTDFIYDPERRAAWLTDAGCRKIVFMPKPSLMSSIDTPRLYAQVEKALLARYGFERDRDYVVVDDKVVIVDESTGRTMDGRKWQDGLHQAVESKELVPLSATTGQAARVTVQSFFRIYSHLSGMTGTGLTAARELWKTYRLPVTKIPTNRPSQRKTLTPRVFATMDAKRQAIREAIEELHQAGRATLVGTPSVEASEALSAMLREHGVDHQVLNAKYHEQEAEIVKLAGRVGRVTIATNMAGRGTDIHLEDEVRERGGLHVIVTEMHTSARIDRQLVGRSARQGDPGSFQYFLSLDDELLRCLPLEVRERVRLSAVPDADGELGIGWLKFFQRTQDMLERVHRRQRRDLLKAENSRAEEYEKMGLDPFLELTE